MRGSVLRYYSSGMQTLANIRLFNLCLEMEDQDILTDIFKMMFSVIKWAINYLQQFAQAWLSQNLCAFTCTVYAGFDL